MQYKADEHYEQYKRIDFQEQCREDSNRHFGKLQQMQHRFLRTARRRYVRGAMAEIVGEAGRQPNRQHKVH